MAGYHALLGDEDTRVFHRTAQTACLAFPIIEIIGADNARLGRGICVVQSAVGQDAAKMCHVARRDGGGSRLDEVYLVGVSGQSVGT